uniref:Uncharacterized protein n=1 Tax=Anguilla anguilla TaxID=7936 RepID=A0A0E9PT47_ANGAN
MRSGFGQIYIKNVRFGMVSLLLLLRRIFSSRFAHQYINRLRLRSSLF